jgi:Protein of unknown function (DUF4058)
MPSPFPGMDPYLEHPEIFPDFHDSFITYLREAIQASLPTPYLAVLGRRIWIELSRRSIGPDVQVRHGARTGTERTESAGGIALVEPRAASPVAVKVAHDELREPFIEIQARDGGGKRLVASIELLSISNKTPGEHGRELYQRKQKELLSGKVHLVEIDLLRAGTHTTAVPLDNAIEACGAFDYHVSVHRFDDVETFFVYPISIGSPLPAIEIPLLPDDGSITLELQAIFLRCYDAGPYGREIQYGVDPVTPALRPDQEVWAANILRAAAN